MGGEILEVSTNSLGITEYEMTAENFLKLWQKLGCHYLKQQNLYWDH
jgi:hypothetical protein